MKQKFGKPPIESLEPYKMMGVKEQPFDTRAGLEQTIGEYGLPAYGLGKSGVSLLGKGIEKFSLNPKKVSKAIQESHDMEKKEASRGFNYVAKEAPKRNADVIPIDVNMINEAYNYFPKTKKYKKLINDAKSGNYDSLRDLQTQLWQKGTAGSKSKNIVDNREAEEIFDLRDRINSDIVTHFTLGGHEDLAKQLIDSMQKYAKLQETYFGKKTPVAIKNLVHEESRKMPKNIFNVLSEESIPMQRIKKETPYAAKKYSQYEKMQKAKKWLEPMLRYALPTILVEELLRKK